jgi:hypothetical protein
MFSTTVLTVTNIHVHCIGIDCHTILMYFTRTFYTIGNKIGNIVRPFTLNSRSFHYSACIEIIPIKQCLNLNIMTYTTANSFSASYQTFVSNMLNRGGFCSFERFSFYVLVYRIDLISYYNTVLYLSNQENDSKFHGF